MESARRLLALCFVLGGGCAADGTPGAGAARLVVAPAVADFGTVAVGDHASEDIVLRNVGGADASVLSMDLEADAGAWFSVDGALPLVPAGGEAVLPVRYAPGEAGYHLARLTLVTDEAVHAVDLRGAAGAPEVQVWPLVADFGPVGPGGAATRTVTIANGGSVPLQVGGALVDGAGFAVTTRFPVELPVGGLQSFTLAYEAADAAEASATLRFALSGGAEAAPVALRANACATGDAALYDTDGDGFSACASDCDDGDPAVRPGGTEVCDGVDQDCDGVVDEGTSCSDDDGDGVTEAGGDCNDGMAGVGPGVAEQADNGVDDDCDGVVDQGTTDADGDGYAEAGGDCAPDDATVYPGAPEAADGADNDCDGTTDEGTANRDGDGDGWTEAAGDCDPTDADVSPGEDERANGVDDDCDGRVDESTSTGDDDGDGWTEAGGDCDDADAAAHPGATEVDGNGADEDCDGVAP